MVMHARKVPRFNDGYYEKKSSHVHYDENINRYSPKNYSSSNQHALNSDYCDSRKRKISPSFESCNSKSESISPDRGFSPYKSSQHYNNSKEYKNRSNKGNKLRRQDLKSRSRSKDRSPERSIERRDRSLEKYSDRFKEKRDRDAYRERYKERSVEKEKKYYEHREYREKEYKKEKYYQRSDCNYSKEKNLNDKRYYEPSSSYYSKEKEKKHGDWTECLSSSGKNYYYNSKTGVSQWDKPKEWSLDGYDQKEHLNFRKEENYDKYYKKKVDEYDYNKRIENDNSSSSSSNQNYNKSHNKYLNDDYEYDNSYNKSCKWRKEDQLSKVHEVKHTKQNGPDDVFSPIDKKIFLKNSQSNGECSKMNNDNLENLIDKNNSLIKSLNSNELSSPSQISKLQKIISQFANLNGLPDLKDLPPQEALRTIQQALQLTSQAKKHSSIKSHKPIDSNSSLSTFISNNVNESPLSSALTRQQQNAIKEHLNLYLKSHNHSMHHHQTIQQHNFHQSTSRQTNNNHSNVSSHQNLHSVDGIRHELDNLFVNKINWAQSPNSDCSLNSSTGSGSSSLVSSASLLDNNILKSSVPTLTPSLSKYFKQELIAHVVNWESEALEKQANRLTEEAHTIGSLNLTRVSAELKMARSLVRLTEIQATLQEQRILFIRQQINNVEEWRSQNLPNFTAFNS